MNERPGSIQVEMYVRTYAGETGSGYPKWETVAQFDVRSDLGVALDVYQEALTELSKPRLLLATTSTDD